MNEEILKLAKDCGIVTTDNKEHLTITGMERFYCAVYNKAIEDAAKVCEAQEDDGSEWDIQQQCANNIRKLENLK